MEDQSKNLILATVLSFVVILVWFVLFPPPEPLPAPAPATATAPAVTPPAAAGAPATDASANATVATAPRIAIDTQHLVGSISLAGGRIDDLSLKTYRQTIEPGADIVRLLKPAGEAGAYYAVYGWAPAGALAGGDVPGASTVWQAAEGASLSPGTPVTLTWSNGKGLDFARQIAVDEQFLFTVTDSVTNSGPTEASLQPYGVIARHGLPTDLQNIFVVHEGFVARTDGALEETDYADAAEFPLVEREGARAQVVEATTDGWIGFTDHYWMTTLIPEQGKPWTAVTKYVPSADIYQAEMRQPVVTVAPGATATTATRLFAGAKEWEAIRTYQNEAAIPGFIDSIDWGWFFFLTKPIFAVLHWLNNMIGNMGLAIIALTFVLKLIVLPLSYKSYVSMARMKELQPEMEALKERVGDDRQRMQKEMMQLYRDKKVNPAAGCLPILIQIPIFFSLYKVIFVTIELRHAPFFGWLNDLSAPDTSSLFNLFGLLPWGTPAAGTILALIFIGVLPILLGVTMWLQQKLNPTPTDPTQAAVFAWMPWIFMFMLGSFASGLVVYWITNNIITFVQQYAIMRSHGHTPDIFGNIRSSFRKKPAVASANANAKPKGAPPKTPPAKGPAKK
ncbi:MAG: membrane protein insertase YidC [Gemmobacter sp.]